MKKKTAPQGLWVVGPRRPRAVLAVRACASAALLASTACDSGATSAAPGMAGELVSPPRAVALAHQDDLLVDEAVAARHPASATSAAPSSSSSASTAPVTARRFITPQPAPHVPGGMRCTGDPLCPM